MRVVISSGHGLYIRGASGYIDEVDEARRVVPAVAKYLRRLGVRVVTYNDDVSTTQDENLERIVDFHNSETRDLDVSVHFNDSDGDTDTGIGTEVWFQADGSQESLAAQIASAIAEAGDLKDRGPKPTTGLYFLNHTSMPAVLLEICFVNSVEDCQHYEKRFDGICEAIAQTIADSQAVA